MYLEKKERNKYTIGKTLRRHKNLRKTDPTAEIVPMPKQLSQYTQQLLAHGLQVKNLKFALFQTKNGLKYPGLIATQKILANTILVKAPTNLLLTTRDAFLSDIQKVFVENPNFFAKRFTSDWEDRILLSYLLYEYQKGPKSRWFNLIRNLPREIDYAVFWDKQQITKLEDKHFQKHIQSERNKFEGQCAKLISILKNYPEFFSPEAITRENIIWIHTHLVTRCFGKYFQYTTMVPFAELFNHECTDVYYTMYYFPDNPHNEHEQFYDEKQLTQQQIDQFESSDGSYEADDFIEDDELIQLEVGYHWDYEQEYKSRGQCLKNYRSILVHIFTFINFSDSVSLEYLGVMLKKLNDAVLIENLQEAKDLFEQIHNTNVRYIKKVKEFYNKIKRKYYSYSIRQKKKPKSESVQDQAIKGQNYFLKEWPKDKFDQFYMLCSNKDQFEKGSQVFFCYGRLPNKLLLMRYGFALEYNKYDHMFLKIDITDQILSQIHLKNVLNGIEINRYKRFKVKRTKMCVQLITYFRGSKWSWGEQLEMYFNVKDFQREIQVLLECKQFYHEYLTHYSQSLQENQKSLSDKSLGYHQYFALVYRIEQQRMLWQQIQMIEYGIEIVKEMKKGKQLKQILLNQQRGEYLTMQLMMEQYLKFF